MPDKSRAAHLAERADDARREAKALQRRVRVLGQITAEIAEEAAALAAEAEKRPVAHRRVD